MKPVISVTCGRVLLCVLALVASVCGPSSAVADAREEKQQLARSILADERMEAVRRRALDLLGTGLNAGSGYAEVWIRDLNTFIVPALEVNPQERIREALLIFLDFQGDDGNIPDGYVPVEKAAVEYKYRTSSTQPKLRAHKNTVETDQESSLVQAVCRYVRKTGDRSILDAVIRNAKVRDRLEQALRYPLTHRYSKEHGLIWGAATADWGDVQPEHPWGVELDEKSHRSIDIYDNALLTAAIGEFIEVVAKDDPAKAQEWSRIRQDLIQATRKHLWDAHRQKFIPHVYLDGSPFPADLDESRIYYHGGTAVAIEAGMLSPNEILISYGHMLANCRMSGAATIGLTLYPPYPAGTFKNPSMGPYSYQNGGDWTWFGARMVRQLARYGYAEEAYRELIPMLDRVIKHEGFHEWWSVDNRPQGSGKYRGSAGVLCEAIDELRVWARQQVGN